MSNWQTGKGRMQRASYRSGLEQKVSTQLEEAGIAHEYEPKWGVIKYTVPEVVKSYTPDFYITTVSGKQIIVETKGIWDSDDRKKHALIRQQYPDLDIRFVFTRSKAKIRKGSQTSYADICEGRGRGHLKGVTWKYADKLIPLEWFLE